MAHESLIGLGIQSFEYQFSCPLENQEEARAERDLGLPEFEDIYYFLACRTQHLYGELQIRYASGFIILDTVLYEEEIRNDKPSQIRREPGTVRALRNTLRALWYHLLHPNTVRTLEAAINKRKYQYLKAHPLVPTNFDDEHESRYEKYKVGSNLDPPTLSIMFRHLEDVSKVPIPHLLQKVVSRTSVYQVPLFPVEAPAKDVENPRAKVGPCRNSWIKLKDDEEKYIAQEIERAESSADYEEYEREKTATTVVHLPPRKSSLMPAAEIGPLSPISRLDKGAGSPVTAVKVKKWLPEATPLVNFQSHTSRPNGSSCTLPVSPMDRTYHSHTSSHTPISPLSKTTSNSTDSRITMASPTGIYSRSNTVYKASTATSPTSKFSRSANPTTPSTAIKTPSIIYSPSSRRLPFHGNEEYLLLPPFPPPKSPEQIARAAHAARAKEAREREMRNENVRLKRENSQLQEVLQQFQDHGRLYRENPYLQVALQQAHTHEKEERENAHMQEAFSQVQAQEMRKPENSQRQSASQQFPAHDSVQREKIQVQKTSHQAPGHHQKLKREQSGLQEALQKIQHSPGGLMKRLGRAGSRARSKSPFKSSRKSLTNPSAEMSTFEMRERGRTSLG
jgi:hypothetical protein